MMKNKKCSSAPVGDGESIILPSSLSVALQISMFWGKIEGGCHPMIIPASLWDVLGDALCFKHLVGKLLGAVCVYHSMNSMAGAMRLLRQHKICKFEYKFSPGHL